MKPALRILHLEDDENDAALVQASLGAGAIFSTTRRVHTRDAFETALDAGEIDLILSDYSMPGFDGISALEIAHTRCPDVPVIFVSGTLGEEKAVDSLKNGATDYILKGSLARLAPAVKRAMEEVNARLERQRLEERFIEAQKMEVIGRLAGGVAHDFNNILAVIMGYNEVMLSEVNPNGNLYQCAVEIRDASERAAGLTKQLLVFSRKQTVQPVVLDLQNSVQKLESMLGRLIGANIGMTITGDNSGGRICADNGYIGQVLMNLVVNARDAMPDGGNLTIATANVTLDQDYADAHPGEKPGDFVRLSVSDTGTGMTDDIKAHLFEAFFTTKPIGKGTGLGLATCQSIVRQSGGHIDVSSKLGHGTVFNVYFPRVDKPGVDAPASVNQIEAAKGGTETLLIVEDEASLRNLARTVLEKRGYKVLLASDGLDGLRAVREHQGTPISLVITDVIMPGMNGRVMANKMLVDHPGLKILFTSGYTDDAIAPEGALDPEVHLLLKPHTPATLARKVRELLDEPVVPPGELQVLEKRILALG
ncbi:MAG: two-component system, cell cycle sensor histidine kinase and response regulator CckA [Verrucomicrobiota bacterium]|jgi:signal transduction histidine kinase